MTDPFIYDSLVNSLGGTVAAEGMSESVPATKVFKLAFVQTGPKVVIALIDGNL